MAPSKLTLAKRNIEMLHNQPVRKRPVLQPQGAHQVCFRHMPVLLVICQQSAHTFAPRQVSDKTVHIIALASVSNWPCTATGCSCSVAGAGFLNTRAAHRGKTTAPANKYR